MKRVKEHTTIIEPDAVYIQLRHGKFYKTKEIEKNILVDYNNKGQVLGIEIILPEKLEITTIKT